jgi:hypothetical protein
VGSIKGNPPFPFFCDWTLPSSSSAIPTFPDLSKLLKMFLVS